MQKKGKEKQPRKGKKNNNLYFSFKEIFGFAIAWPFCFCFIFITHVCVCVYIIIEVIF